MNEIEVKIFNINKNKIICKLISLNAKKVFDGKLTANLYKSKTEDMDFMLRLRSDGKESYLTYKKGISKDEVKITKELEVKVEDFKKMNSIIENIGFCKKQTLIKNRESYIVIYEDEKIRIEFDEYLGKYSKVPLFMEIEAPSKKSLIKFAKVLGISKEDFDTSHTSQLIRKYYPNV